jgi:hypothetical protein
MAISIRLLTVTYIPSTALLVALTIASLYKHIPIVLLLRDPVAVANMHPVTGVLSNLGVLLWCSSAAICLFSGVVLHQALPTRRGWFLICSALLTLGLLFDDFFLFHDFLAQRYLSLSQEVIIVFWGGVTAAYVLIFRRVILQSDYAILCVAFVLFAVSAGMDIVSETELWQFGDWSFLVEDGAKFLALASWCSYYVRVSYQFVLGRPSVVPARGPGPRH